MEPEGQPELRYYSAESDNSKNSLNSFDLTGLKQFLE